MEIQIRTEDMDRVAKEGIAAHWAYKEGLAVSQKDARLFQWLKQLILELKELKDPQEFLEAVKTEVRSAQVYVLTPGGEVKELPLDATPLDFAYSIHSKVGDHCVGAKVNGRIVPLRHTLQNGDLVEIITSPKQQPSRAWLSIIKTSRARSHIRNWLNREEKERSLELGRELCERELRKHGISLKKEIRHAHFPEALKALGCSTLEELLRKAAYGKITIQAIVEVLRPEEIKEEEKIAAEQTKAAAPQKPTKDGGITIDGIDDILVKISQCCLPLPGDDIMGFITAGRGISIHKVNCPNFLATDALRHVEVNWTSAARAVHRSQIHITAHDKKGLIATISKAISTDDANIIGLEARSTEDQMAKLIMDVEVTDLSHLTSLLQHLRQMEEVLTVERK
jgi:GTP pyrophosphokinase